MGLTTNCLAVGDLLNTDEVSFRNLVRMDLAAFEDLLYITSNETSSRTEPVCGSLFQAVNDCVARRIEKYALKIRPE